MPRNGTGTYFLPEPPFVAGTVISSAAMNDNFSDIAAALTGSLPRDGTAGMTGQVKGTDGSVLLPTFSFSNATSTGFFRNIDGSIGIAVGGVQIANFSSTGLVGSVPFGAVVDYAAVSGAVPAGWMLCYGQAVSRTTFDTLFSIVGTAYGSGDGATTFNLPDYRGTIGVGKADMGGVATTRLTTAGFGTSPSVLGNRGGNQTFQLSATNIPNYTPTGTITVVNGQVLIGGSSSITVGTQNGVSYAPNAGSNQGAINNTLAITQQTSSATFTGTATGGASTAFSLVQPSLIVNKIIYAGLGS